jgi:hypothetical protein
MQLSAHRSILNVPGFLVLVLIMDLPSDIFRYAGGNAPVVAYPAHGLANGGPSVWTGQESQGRRIPNGFSGVLVRSNGTVAACTSYWSRKLSCKRCRLAVPTGAGGGAEASAAASSRNANATWQTGTY